MHARQLSVALGKLLLSGLMYFIGLMIGSMLTSLLQLPQPPMPEGVDQAAAALALLSVSPLLALGLLLIAPNIAGGWLTRTLILSGLTYVAYTLNNVLDAALYMTAYRAASVSTTVSMLVPSLFVGAAVALLFPPQEKYRSFFAACKLFFRRRSPGQWFWRLLLAGLVFAPVYIFFGLLVNPITGDYYRQNMFGLQAAGWEQILPVQFVRSFLFLLACLPVFIAWQKSQRSLLLNLGTVLFVLVGFLYTLMAYWLPLKVRVPHSIEILADSFVYAALLTWLLAGQFPFSVWKRPAALAQQSQVKAPE